VEKLGLIVPLCHPSHFPVHNGLSTCLKYLTQSANVLSVTQVDLSFQCGAAVGLFLPRSMTCASGLPTLDGNGCGQPLYLLIGASRKCVGGSREHLKAEYVAASLAGQEEPCGLLKKIGHVRDMA